MERGKTVWLLFVKNSMALKENSDFQQVNTRGTNENKMKSNARLLVDIVQLLL